MSGKPQQHAPEPFLKKFGWVNESHLLLVEGMVALSSNRYIDSKEKMDVQFAATRALSGRLQDSRTLVKIEVNLKQ